MAKMIDKMIQKLILKRMMEVVKKYWFEKLKNKI